MTNQGELKWVNGMPAMIHDGEQYNFDKIIRSKAVFSRCIEVGGEMTSEQTISITARQFDRFVLGGGDEQ